MEDGSRLGKKDVLMLVENIDWELVVPLLFTHLVCNGSNLIIATIKLEHHRKI
jgi:hypothetical protein